VTGTVYFLGSVGDWYDNAMMGSFAWTSLKMAYSTTWAWFVIVLGDAYDEEC
jgi:hypothetical protein